MDTGFLTVAWDVCLGLGLAVTPPILAGPRGAYVWERVLASTPPILAVVCGMCVWVRVLLSLHQIWLGCCGMCVCLCALPVPHLGSSGFVVPKKEKGKWRLVAYYRQINEATLPDAYPLPLIEKMFQNQSKHKIFTMADLKKGFHQIPLHPDSRAKTAMNLAGKQCQWRVMPMGIKNGPAIFQRVMDHVLRGLDCADVYIDAIIIDSSGDTEEELLANHNRHVRAVLDRQGREELGASVSKTDFLVRSVEFCGHL